MNLVDTQQEICEYIDIHGHNTGTTRLDLLVNENKWDSDWMFQQWTGSKTKNIDGWMCRWH